MIEFTEGDLFDAPQQYGAKMLAHGVNAAGVMGAGIAVAFRERFPDMYADYRNACITGNLRAGDLFMYRPFDSYWIANLCTQPATSGATYDAVWSSLTRLVGWLETADTSDKIDVIAMPQIAAGLGGLNWDVVRAMLVANFDTPAMSNRTLVVYEKFVPSQIKK